MRMTRMVVGGLVATGLLAISVTARTPASKQLTLTEVYQTIKTKQFVDLTHAFEPGIPTGKAFLMKSGKLSTGMNLVSAPLVVASLPNPSKITASGHEPTDTDPGIATSKNNYSLETYILQQNHYQIELLNNLDQVPEAGALVVVAFPKPKNGSGFPARVFAILP